MTPLKIPMDTLNVSPLRIGYFNGLSKADKESLVKGASFRAGYVFFGHWDFKRRIQDALRLQAVPFDCPGQ
jgi:hypothetical protein